MANNILDIAILSPLKFRRKGYVNPAPYNTRYMDDWNYPDTIPSFMEQAPWLQPWQQNDIIPLQLLSNYNPHNLYLKNCEGDIVDDFVSLYKPSSIEGSGQKVYEFSIGLNTYPEGKYQFVLEAGLPILDTLESEWIDLRALHEGSVQFRYKHNENDHDVVFETGIEFYLRCFGGFLPQNFQPGADRVVVIDQTRNAIQLSGRSFYTDKLIIGDSRGVPAWVAQQVNEIFLCSQVLIDGKQWVGSEGQKFEGTTEENYPLVGWSFDVRPADFQNRKRFEVSGTSNNPSSVVYQIDADGFGQITGTASTNIVQIESLN